MSELKSSEGEEAWAWEGFQEGKLCSHTLTLPSACDWNVCRGPHTHLQNSAATSEELQSQDNDVNDHVSQCCCDHVANPSPKSLP